MSVLGLAGVWFKISVRTSVALPSLRESGECQTQFAVEVGTTLKRELSTRPV